MVSDDQAAPASYPKLAIESLVVKTTPSFFFYLVQGVKSDVNKTVEEKKMTLKFDITIKIFEFDKIFKFQLDATVFM